jgi:hypothetical protein
MIAFEKQQPVSYRMKSPAPAAALLVLPLIFAVLGVVFSANNATNFNLSASGLSAVYTFGNRQITAQTPVTGTTQTLKIVGPCSGQDQCSQSPPPDPNDPTASCFPSSVWGLVVVNQVFASVAIFIQAAAIAALYLGRGTRKLHQFLCFLAALCLLISLSTVVSVASRQISLCMNIPPSGVTISYSLDFGG